MDKNIENNIFILDKFEHLLLDCKCIFNLLETNNIELEIYLNQIYNYDGRLFENIKLDFDFNIYKFRNRELNKILNNKIKEIGKNLVDLENHISYSINESFEYDFLFSGGLGTDYFEIHYGLFDLKKEFFDKDRVIKSENVDLFLIEIEKIYSWKIKKRIKKNWINNYIIKLD